MKGWPLLRSFVTLLGILVAGLPLRSLTRVPAPPLPVVVAVPQTEKLSIALTFTQPPEKFSLKYLGKEILAGGEGSSFDAATTIDAHYPKEGIDLVFEGTWPEYFRKVGVIVNLTRANGVQQTQTIWGKRNLFELMTFCENGEP